MFGGNEPEWLYPASIVTLLIMEYMLWQMDQKFMMGVMFLIGVYIVWNHETGHTLGEYKRAVINDFDEAVGNNEPGIRGNRDREDEAIKEVRGDGTSKELSKW